MLLLIENTFSPALPPSCFPLSVPPWVTIIPLFPLCAVLQCTALYTAEQNTRPERHNTKASESCTLHSSLLPCLSLSLSLHVVLSRLPDSSGRGFHLTHHSVSNRSLSSSSCAHSLWIDCYLSALSKVFIHIKDDQEWVLLSVFKSMSLTSGYSHSIKNNCFSSIFSVLDINPKCCIQVPCVQ